MERQAGALGVRRGSFPTPRKPTRGPLPIGLKLEEQRRDASEGNGAALARRLLQAELTVLSPQRQRQQQLLLFPGSKSSLPVSAGTFASLRVWMSSERLFLSPFIFQFPPTKNFLGAMMGVPGPSARELRRRREGQRAQRQRGTSLRAPFIETRESPPPTGDVAQERAPTIGFSLGQSKWKAETVFSGCGVIARVLVCG